MTRSPKVIVMGGGPAGSTAAILLSLAGIKVTLYEKDKHPRYHVGESGILSLPYLLELLGVEKELQAKGFKKKGGVFFDWNHKWIINWGASGEYTYHVVRSEFDEILIQRAKNCGVKVIENAAITDIEFCGDCPKTLHISQNGKTFKDRADFIVDATGRNALLARKYFKSQKSLNAFKNVALWGYWFKAKDPALLRGFEDVDGYDEKVQNPILISSITGGWIWGIPLHNGQMSVGVVLSQNNYEKLKKNSTKKEIYLNSIKQSQCAHELLKKALFMSEVRQTADWSYFTEKWAGDGYFIVGDAAVFIDPLLSTGMTSAMLSSVSAAACLKEILIKGTSPQKVYDFYESDYKRRFWRLSFVIGALYSAKGHPDDLFYQTHSLTSQDLNGAAYKDIKRSFSSVISGLEDLKEIKASQLQKIAGERLRENFKRYINIIPKMPYVPRNEVELVFEPLGLHVN